MSPRTGTASRHGQRKAELDDLLDRLVVRWGPTPDAGRPSPLHPVQHPIVEVTIDGDLIPHLCQRWAGRPAIDYSKPDRDGRGEPRRRPVGSFLTGTLAMPSDNLFAVRAFDDVSGVEEANTDARVHVIMVDGVRARHFGSAERRGRPGSLAGRSATSALVSWGYIYDRARGGRPLRFDVTASPAIRFSQPRDPSAVQTVAYAARASPATGARLGRAGEQPRTGRDPGGRRGGDRCARSAPRPRRSLVKGSRGS